MQTASSSSCCGFSRTWRFPSIQYGLHAILPWSAAVWTVCVGYVGKLYSRKLHGRLLQRCDRAVLPCRKRQRLGMLEIGGERGLQQLKWTIMYDNDDDDDDDDDDTDSGVCSAGSGGTVADNDDDNNNNPPPPPPPPHHHHHHLHHNHHYNHYYSRNDNNCDNDHEVEDSKMQRRAQYFVL